MLVISIIAFLFGASIGSFLNVVIYRLPRNESIVSPRSHCTSCNEFIAWYDNVPILSYLILRGRCRHCGAEFSARYALVEALTGGFAVLLVLVPVLDMRIIMPALNTKYLVMISVPYFIWVSSLIAASFIDIDYQIIPDRISLGGIPIGFLVATFLNPAVGLKSSLLGIAVGGGSLLVVALGYWAVTRKEGMGMGDVKLMGMLGAWLGWGSIPFILIVASLVGAVIGVAIMVKGRGGFKAKVPFGPFLAGAAVLYLFLGRQIIDLYLGMLSTSQ